MGAATCLNRHLKIGVVATVCLKDLFLPIGGSTFRTDLVLHPMLFGFQIDCAFSCSLFSDLLKVSYITYLFPFLHCSPYKLNV